MSITSNRRWSPRTLGRLSASGIAPRSDLRQAEITLHTAEASLTGESLPTAKDADLIAGEVHDWRESTVLVRKLPELRKTVAELEQRLAALSAEGHALAGDVDDMLEALRAMQALPAALPMARVRVLPTRQQQQSWCVHRLAVSFASFVAS